MSIISSKEIQFYMHINVYTGKKHIGATSFDMRKVMVTRKTYYFLGIPVFSSDKFDQKKA